MVPYLGCEDARARLQAFVDDELPMDEQVSLETHLRWCRTCAAHVEDLRAIGDSIRLRATSRRSSTHDPELAALQAGVLSRMCVEREHSLAAQVRSLFDDRHLLWAGLGAFSAVIVCLFGMMGVLHAAADERPDSLAGVIEALATPGSNRNPVRLDAYVSVPRAIDDSPGLEQIRHELYQLRAEEDASIALAAVVTTEGRVANYELLFAERDAVRRRSAAARAGDVASLLDAVGHARFAPAQRVGGAPVAVNMVWLLSRTTVKGNPRAVDLDIVEPREERPPAPAVKPSAEQESQENQDQVSSDVALPRGSASA